MALLTRTVCTGPYGVKGRSRAPAFACVLMLALIGGCGISSGVATNGLDEPVELELRLGEERVVGESEVRVAFRAVLEDSRCPLDVVCVWAGNAAIEIRLGGGTGRERTIVLNTGFEPRAAESTGLLITLQSLSPTPRQGQSIRPEDYVVRLRLEPAGPGPATDRR